MSLEGQMMIYVWALVTAVVFLVAALALDGADLDKKEKVWIGRIGLAAPLWPVMAIAAIVTLLAFMARELFRAARGRE